MGENSGGDGLQGRASTFFIIIGIGLLVLFYVSDKNGMFNLWYFIAGAATLGFGWFLFVKRPRSEGQSQRFMGIRKWSANRKAKKEARAKAKADKQAQKSAKKKNRWFSRS